MPAVRLKAEDEPMAALNLIFDGKPEKSWQLTKERTVVGRDPDCDVPIDNLGISRKHCAVERRGEAFVLMDLGASNGTYCNGKKVSDFYLNDGDEITFGKHVLLFKRDPRAKKLDQEAQLAAAAAQAEAKESGMEMTYMMDGKKMREQVEARYRATRLVGAEEAKLAAAGGKSAGAAGGISPVYKTLFFLSVAVDLALGGALVYLFFFAAKGGG
jgi:hypothetical protein